MSNNHLPKIPIYETPKSSLNFLKSNTTDPIVSRTKLVTIATTSEKVTPVKKASKRKSPASDSTSKKTRADCITPLIQSYLERVESCIPNSFDCFECHRLFKTKAGFISHVTHKHLKLSTVVATRAKPLSMMESTDDHNDGPPVLFPEVPFDVVSIQPIELSGINVTDFLEKENENEGHFSEMEMDSSKNNSDGVVMDELAEVMIEEEISVPDPDPDPTPSEKTQVTKDTIICEHCTETFPYRTKVQIKTFKDHEEIHQGLRPFVCPYCLIGFQSAIRLLTHSTFHNGESNFDCETCSQKFKNKAKLLIHFKNCKIS